MVSCLGIVDVAHDFGDELLGRQVGDVVLGAPFVSSSMAGLVVSLRAISHSSGRFNNI